MKKAREQAQAIKDQHKQGYKVENVQQRPSGPESNAKNPQHQKKDAVTQSFNSKQYAAQQEAGKKQPTSADRVQQAAIQTAKQNMPQPATSQQQKTQQPQKPSKLESVRQKAAAGMEKMREAGRKGSAAVSKVMQKQQAPKSQGQSQTQSKTPSSPPRDRGR